MKYCTYVRFRGIVGLLYGWFLVGISEEKAVSGYVDEFAGCGGIKIMLVEMQIPLRSSFYFIPRKAKIICSSTFDRFKNEEKNESIRDLRQT